MTSPIIREQLLSLGKRWRSSKFRYQVSNDFIDFVMLLCFLQVVTGLLQQQETKLGFLQTNWLPDCLWSRSHIKGPRISRNILRVMITVGVLVPVDLRFVTDSSLTLPVGYNMLVKRDIIRVCVLGGRQWRLCTCTCEFDSCRYCDTHGFSETRKFKKLNSEPNINILKSL